jgi:hypothetical protein
MAWGSLASTGSLPPQATTPVSEAMMAKTAEFVADFIGAPWSRDRFTGHYGRPGLHTYPWLAWERPIAVGG